VPATSYAPRVWILNFWAVSSQETFGLPVVEQVLAPQVSGLLAPDTKSGKASIYDVVDVWYTVYAGIDGAIILLPLLLQSTPKIATINHLSDGTIVDVYLKVITVPVNGVVHCTL
jgi:hypothetical protein